MRGVPHSPVPVETMGMGGRDSFATPWRSQPTDGEMVEEMAGLFHRRFHWNTPTQSVDFSQPVRLPCGRVDLGVATGGLDGTFVELPRATFL